MKKYLFMSILVIFQIYQTEASTIQCRRPNERFVGNTCEKCPRCKIGWGLTESCHSTSGNKIHCAKCEDGKTYQNEMNAILQCKNCTSCSKQYNREVKYYCRRQVNTECGNCVQNYFDPDHDYIGSEPRRCVHCLYNLYHAACSTNLARYQKKTTSTTISVTENISKSSEVNKTYFIKGHENNQSVWSLEFVLLFSFSIILVIVLISYCAKDLWLSQIRRKMKQYKAPVDDPSLIPMVIAEKRVTFDLNKDQADEPTIQPNLRRRMSLTKPSIEGNIRNGVSDFKENVSEPLKKRVFIDEDLQGAISESAVCLQHTPDVTGIADQSKQVRSSAEHPHSACSYSDSFGADELIWEPQDKGERVFEEGQVISAEQTYNYPNQKREYSSDVSEETQDQHGHVNIINITNITENPMYEAGIAEHSEPTSYTSFKSKRVDEVDKAHRHHLQQMKREQKEKYERAMEITKGKQIKDIDFDFKTRNLYLNLDVKTDNLCPNWKTLGAAFGIEELKLKILENRPSPSEGLLDILSTQRRTIPELLEALNNIGHDYLVVEMSNWVVENLPHDDGSTQAVEETSTDKTAKLI